MREQTDKGKTLACVCSFMCTFTWCPCVFLHLCMHPCMCVHVHVHVHVHIHVVSIFARRVCMRSCTTCASSIWKKRYIYIYLKKLRCTTWMCMQCDVRTQSTLICMPDMYEQPLRPTCKSYIYVLTLIWAGSYYLYQQQRRG